MEEEIVFDFTPTSPLLEFQARVQGYTLGEKALDFEGSLMCIYYLTEDGILNDKEHSVLLGRLNKLIIQTIKKIK